MHESIDRLVDFIAERDPAFPEHIKGASDEQIARLEAAVGQPLPAVYRQFLVRMGCGTGWLTFAAAKFDVESLIRYHEFAALPDPAGFLLIGRASDDPCYDVYLWQENPDRLRVVSFPPPPPHDIEQFLAQNMFRLGGSLPQLLGDAALKVFTHHLLGFHRQVEHAVQGHTARIGLVDDFMAGQGIAPLWYANDWARSYEAPGVLVKAHEQLSTGRLIVDVRADTQARFDQLFAPLRSIVKGER